MKFRKLAAGALALAMLAGVSACATDPEDLTAEELVEAWSVSNTEKVLLDKEYAAEEKTDKTVSVEMAKGEYDGAQLILTAKEAVNSLRVTVGDLTCGTSVIPSENIDVLFEKYVNIESMSSPLAQGELGYYPDALVPIDAIIAAGENKIEKGHNQGIWIKVQTPEDIATGTYTADITVTVNGDSMTVPLSVKVWNFAIPATTNMSTTFNNFRDYLIGGELDNTPEMYEKYYDFFLDYRISLTQLPYAEDLDSFVASAKKYAADERCASYGMSFNYLGQTNVDGVAISNETDWQDIHDKLVALAKESTPELNLLEKLNFYDQSIDEPAGTNRIPDANYKNKKFLQVLDEVVAELDADPEFDWEKNGVSKDDILGLEYVITTAYQSNMPDFRTYCPMVDAFNTQEKRDRYETERNKSEYNTTWWYVCWTPQYPYPNYRIEESALGARVMSWMQKDYDITGLLYWGTSVYAALGNADGTRPRDPYDDPYSYQRITMDGCLTYPGRPYDIDGPVGSIRLENIRDGIEDYDYLCMLEEQLESAASAYDATVSFDEVMRPLYDSLYTDVTPSYQQESFVNARSEVAGMLELLNTDAKAFAYVSSTNVNTNTATLTVYASAETEVSVDGTVLTGSAAGASGKKYEYQVDLSKQSSVSLTFRTGDETFTTEKYIGRSTNAVQLVENGKVLLTASNGTARDPKEHITLSPNASEYLTAAGAMIQIAKYESEKDSVGAMLYNPEVYIGKESAFPGVSLADFDTFEFIIYNATGEERTLQVYLQSQSQQKLFGTFTLKPGENTVTLQQIYINNWTNLSTADTIVLTFEKCETDTPDVYYIDNMFYTLKEN